MKIFCPSWALCSSAVKSRCFGGGFQPCAAYIYLLEGPIYSSQIKCSPGGCKAISGDQWWWLSALKLPNLASSFFLLSRRPFPKSTGPTVTPSPHSLSSFSPGVVGPFPLSNKQLPWPPENYLYNLSVSC